jgi:hypothetical protein
MSFIQFLSIERNIDKAEFKDLLKEVELFYFIWMGGVKLFVF